jgi:predicted nucleic-acid-binding protein
MKGNADYLPDTNAVLRYLLQDDADQFPLAETFFKKVMEGRTRVIFLEGVLVECLYVLTKYYKVTRAEAANSLIGLLHYKGVVNRDKTALVEGLQTFATSSLDPVDCLLIARSRVDGLQVFSFDKQLNKSLNSEV